MTVPANLDSGAMFSFEPASLFANGEAGGWYDPSDLSTLWQDTAGTTAVTASNQSVARIDDKSGNGRHLTQGTTTSRPTYQESGGVHWLQFDGSDDLLVTSSNATPMFSNAAFLIAASSQDQADAIGASFGEGYLGADIYRVGVYHDTRSSPRVTAIFQPNGGPPLTVDNDSEITGDPALFSFNSNGTTGGGYIDNVMQGSSISTSANFAANTNIFMGVTPIRENLGLYLDGNIYGALIVDRELTSQERFNLNNWLSKRAGI